MILRYFCGKPFGVSGIGTSLIALMLFASVFQCTVAKAQTPPSADPFAKVTPAASSQAVPQQTPAGPGQSTPAGATKETGSSTPAQDASSVPAGETPGTEGSAKTQDQPAGTALQPPVSAEKKPPVVPDSGKQKIAIQLPSHRLLMSYLRVGQENALARIRSTEKAIALRLTKAGMDPNISIDDAMKQGKLVFAIYFTKTDAVNVLSHGFKLKASLCQYWQKPSGQVVTLRYSNIGESTEVYSAADLENKAVMLCEVYLSARHARLKEANKVKPATKKKRGK